MSKDARQPLAAWRNEACAFPITIVGVDATGSGLRMQARLAPGAPGPALIDLGTVTNGNAQGLRLVSVIKQNDVPVSSFQLRINKSTLQALPAYGELGEALELAYALQLDGSTIMHGPLLVLDSAIDSDDASDDRYAGFFGRLDASSATDGVVLTKLGGGVTVEIGGAAFIGAAVEDARASREAAAASKEVATTQLRLTRDPTMALREKLGPGIYGDTTYLAGMPHTARRVITGAIFGNSLGVGQGAATLAATPTAQARAVIVNMVPEVDARWDVYAVPGSWQTQMGEQIDAMLAAHAAAMAPGGDGRSRIPEIAIFFVGTNDARTTIYFSLEGPIVYRNALRDNIKRLQDMGAVVIVVTAPEINGPRALADGMFDMSPAFFSSYPKTAFYAGDDKFQLLTYSKANQTIATSTPGQFTPGLYDNGMLSFDGKSWIYVPEQNKYMRIVGADVTYSILTVDDGNGGPVITEDRQTKKGFYQAKINDQTQLVPAKNNRDLSRPAGAQAGVPLVLERRPVGPSGEMILVSLPLNEINRGTREVATQMGAIVLPWAEAQHRLLTSDAVLDRLYPGGEYLHQGDEGYLLLTPLLRRVIGRAVIGNDVGTKDVDDALADLDSALVAVVAGTDRVNAVSETAEQIVAGGTAILAAVPVTTAARNTSVQKAQEATAAAATAQAVARYYPVIADAVAQLAVGVFFTSDDRAGVTTRVGQLRTYLRIAAAPGWQDQGDSASPVSVARLTGLPMTLEMFGIIGDGVTNERERVRSAINAAAAAKVPLQINRRVFVDIDETNTAHPIQLPANARIDCIAGGALVLRFNQIPVFFAVDAPEIDLSRAVFEMFPGYVFTDPANGASEAVVGAFKDARLPACVWRGGWNYRAVIVIEACDRAKLGATFRVRAGAAVGEYFTRCISVNGEGIASWTMAKPMRDLDLTGLIFDGCIMGITTSGCDGIKGDITTLRAGSRAVFSGVNSNEPPPHSWYNTGWSKNVSLRLYDKGLEPATVVHNGQNTAKPRYIDGFDISVVSFRRHGACDFSGRNGVLRVKSVCDLVVAHDGPNGIFGYRGLSDGFHHDNVDADIDLTYTNDSVDSAGLIQMTNNAAALIRDSRYRFKINFYSYPFTSASSPLFVTRAENSSFDIVLTSRTAYAGTIAPFLWRTDGGAGGNSVRFTLNNLSYTSYRMDTNTAVPIASAATVTDTTGAASYTYGAGQMVGRRQLRKTASNLNGASVQVADLIPAGAQVLATSAVISTTLGPSQGCAGFKLGTLVNAPVTGAAAKDDRYGVRGSTGAGGAITNAHWTDPAVLNYSNAAPLVLTAVGGPFDGTGAITITVTFQINGVSGFF